MHTSPSCQEITRRRATGMTRAQVAVATEAARLHERLRSWSCGSPVDRVVVRSLEQAHEEWLRISCVMAAEKLTTYHPDHDPALRQQEAQQSEQALHEDRALASAFGACW
ncbi:hypothetical protein [Streptacidiphilus sp. EB129]|jgi:hypothetical protein|uniref:hypothetical protein n=1 Tax=Streptacidiphilus sp. EB129 TaxID=3156262 RepID=UPI0035135CEF